MKKIYAAMALVITLLLLNVGCFVYFRSIRMNQYDSEAKAFQNQRVNIHNALIGTLDLASLGEQMLNWDEDVLVEYRRQRVWTDSALFQLRGFYSEQIIDSMRQALQQKEHLLTRISETVDMKKENEIHLTKDKKIVVNDTVTTIEKLKGTIFNKHRESKTSKSTSRTVVVSGVDEVALAMQQVHNIDLEILTDSLADVNVFLRQNIRKLVRTSDGDIVRLLKENEDKAREFGHSNFKTGMSILTVTSILLVGLFIWLGFVIHRLKKEVWKNQSLIENRRYVMYSIVHDLRSPIGLISGLTDLQRKSNRKMKSSIDGIAFATKQLLRMIDQLLDYFKLESNKSELKCRNFSLIEMVNELVQAFEYKATEKHLEFIKPQQQNVTLYGDYDKINHIVMNLLDNAFKFTEKGRVQLCLNYASGNLHIDVKDTGIGIKESDWKKVFTSFSRFSNAMATGKDGFGIGLSIVKMLVDLMDGTISFDSVEGKGTLFHVILPLAEGIVTNESINAEYVKVSTKRKRILVVDDCEHWLDFFRKMLKDSIYDCDACNNGATMSRMLRKNHYDLVILDLKMQGQSGLELMQAMKATRVGNSNTVPVIACSSSGEEVRDELVKKGFDEYIDKTFSTEELLNIINKVITKSSKTVSPDFTRLSKSVAKSLRRETINTVKALHKAVDETDFIEMESQAHRLKSSWVVYRIGVLVDPIMEVARNRDANAKERLGKYMAEVDKMAAIVTAKTEELIKQREDEQGNRS